MKISQLFSEGHRRIRLPQWNDRAYLQLRECPGKNGPIMGPGATMHDPVSMRAIRACEAEENRGERFTLPPVLLFQVDADDWEAYIGPEDDFEDDALPVGEG